MTDLTFAPDASPVLDALYGRYSVRWRFKDVWEDFPCLRTSAGELAKVGSADPCEWPQVVHEVVFAMEAGLPYRRAVEAVVSGGLAGALSEADVRRLVRRMGTPVERELRALELDSAEAWLDEAVAIADGELPSGEAGVDSVARDKLRVDTRLELARLRAKDRYKPTPGQGGDGGGVTITVLRLSEARSEAQVTQAQDALDVEWKEVPRAENAA